MEDKKDDVVLDEIVTDDEANTTINNEEKIEDNRVEVVEEIKTEEEKKLEKAKKEQEKKLKKENKKELNKAKRKNAAKRTVETYSTYKFIVKILAAALLIVFSIILLVEKSNSIFTILLVTGIVPLIVAVIRIFYYLFNKKKLNKKSIKVTFVVTLIQVLIAIYLIISAVAYKDDTTSKFSDFNRKYFAIFLAGLLYIESIGYFMNSILFNIKSTKFMFWLHIIFITLSSIILAISNNLELTKVIVGLAVILILLALLLIAEATTGYFGFRNGTSKPKDKKEEKIDEEIPNAIIEPENKNEEAIVN